MSSLHPCFEIGKDAMNVRQNVYGFATLALHSAIMDIARPCQSSVAVPSVSVHDGTAFNFLFDKTGQ